MSRRRRSSKSSSSSNADLALGILGMLMRNGNRRLLAILALAVVFLVIGGAFFLWSQGYFSPKAEEQASDEAVAGQVGRLTEAPDPNVTAAGLGSGTETRTDWYELHFTRPTYPDNKANHKGGVDEQLVQLMKRATRTLDVADYDFDLPNVTDEMVAAKKRGVQVRMVTDSDTLNNVKNVEVQSAFAKLKTAAIPIVDDNRGPIMHNKFTVVDREWIQTGSWNYTIGDTYRLNNNMIIIRNRELAQNYTVEFEKMFVKKQFGPSKDKGVPFPVLTISGTKVQNYFAPEDNVADKIIETVKTARQSVYFMAFSFTQDGIGTAIIDKAKAGLRVGGVFEKTGSDTKYSEYGKMKQAGLDVYTDGNPYVMHHKVIIIDERTVVFGSFNFSDNADKSNDENVLIIEDPTLARAFKQEYDSVLNLAKNPPVRR